MSNSVPKSDQLQSTAGGSGRSLGTATNEDTHLIWWSRLGRQSVYLLQCWTLPVDHPSFSGCFRQNQANHECSQKYLLRTSHFAVIMHDWFSWQQSHRSKLLSYKCVFASIFDEKPRQATNDFGFYIFALQKSKTFWVCMGLLLSYTNSM